MMGRRVILGIVISSVVRPRPREKSELFLIDCPVAKPVESHVHGFCAFGLYSAVDDAVGRRVVCLNGGARMLVPHLLQYYSFFDCLACIYV